MNKKESTALQWVLFTILALMVLICKGQEVDGTQDVVNSNNLFTEDVYQELTKLKPSANFIVSPFSLASVLTMLRAGANGKTADELTEGLRLQNVNDSTLYEGYSDLIFQLHENKNVVVETANRVFTADGYEIKDSYLKLLKEKFYSRAESVDFTQFVQAADKINRFVATATHSKIKEILKSDTLDEDTKLVLVNAIYFKGVWKYKFQPENTIKTEFNTLDGNNVSVNMMNVQGEFNYRRIARLHSAVASIPYEGGRFVLVVILPNENILLPDVEKLLTNSILVDIPSKLKPTELRLQLPKFTLESEFNFAASGLLQNLGIKQMLSSKADFKGITDKVGLFVNSVVQKALIEINEEGTVAAAASAAVITVKSEVAVTDFEVNRPFVAYIFDELTNSVLFILRKVD